MLCLPIASYFASGWLLAELGRRLFNPQAGVLAAVVLLSQPFMLETSLRENFTDPILVALILGCVLAIVSAAERAERSEDTTRPLVVAGVLLGLSQYARSAALVLYIPVIALILTAVPIARYRAIAIVLGSAVATQLPLFIFNIASVGSATFTPTYILLFLSEAFPGLASFSVLLPTSTTEVMSQYRSRHHPEVAEPGVGSL